MKSFFVLVLLAVVGASHDFEDGSHHEINHDHRNEIKHIIRHHPKYRITPDGPVPHAPSGHVSHVPVNKTHLAHNNITVEEHNSLKDEIVYLKEQYAKVRAEFNHWMTTPYHRTVVLPAIIGSSFGLLTIILYILVKKCCRVCKKKCSRTYMGRRQRYDVNDKKNLLGRKHESDDEI